MADPTPLDTGRRLAAIMFTDVAGFTALSGRNEGLALELLEEHRRLIRPLLARHNGREIKTMGDGFMVEFASSLEAVLCAVEIQSALEEANAGRGNEQRLQVRIGIHLGDVIHTGGDLAGDAVNLASRIEALAPAGGICVTEPVRSSVINQVRLTFKSLGKPNLKNVASPIEVFSISGWDREAVAVTPIQRGPQPHDRIAILPFANLSPDPTDEYFADGMTEELIASVSQTKGLHVIARTSVMRYKGAGKPVAEIGRELNVGSVLEGSVRKSGNKLRISVQLVETTNEEPRWSQNYDRELKDVFEIQSDIARRVTEQLRTHVLGLPAAGATTTTRSTKAYIDYLAGRQLWNKRTEHDLKRSVGFFERAIQADGDYAKAYSGMADAYAALALLEFLPPSEAYPKAQAAVERALALDPELAEAHSSQGLIHFQFDWDWPGAEQAFRRAIEINPNYAAAHQFYADYLKALGRFDEALEQIKNAQELDPLSLAINTAVGHVLYLSRKYDKAIEQYQRAVDLDPGFMMTHLWFGRPYLEKGMFAEAISELETAVMLSGESTMALGMLGHGLAAAGRRAEASQVLYKLKERSKNQYVPSYWIAVIHNGFKDRGQTISWLRKAFEERSSWLVWCNVEPRFDWLRDDPDFVELMKKMKLL